MQSSNPNTTKSYTLEEAVSYLIDYRGKTPKKTLSGIPLVTAKIVKNGRLKPYNEYIAEDNYDSWMVRGIPQEGDIVLTVEAPLGEVAQLDGTKIALAQRIVTLRGKQNILYNDYLLYLLQSKKIQVQLEARSSGSTVKGIKQSELRKLTLDLPSLKTQKEIAHILSTLDDKIELNRKMNETLEAMAQALFKSWFVDFDPVHVKATCKSEQELEVAATKLGISKEILDLFPSEFEESEMGMIPLGWKVVKFKKLVAKYIDNRGKTPPNQETGIPLLEVKNLPQEVLTPLYRTQKYVTEETYNTWFRTHLEEDDTLISTVGTIGLTNIVPPNSKFTIAQNVLGLRANTDYLKKKYMYFMMKSKRFLHDIDARLVTTVQSSIKRKDLETIDCLVPDINLQKKFVSIIAPMLEKMQSDEILSLQKIRDTLLPKLLSGELDV